MTSWYDVAKVGFFLAGVPRNAFGSIDVTSRCNLHCAHCYYFGDRSVAPPGELSVEQWVAGLEDLRRATPRWEFPFFNCSWVGGEPLLRPRLVDRCRRLFRYNTVVTNGTIELPQWPDVNWYISMDGDEQAHEALRRTPGCYARTRDNVRRNAHLGVTIACCINRQNAHCVGPMVQRWRDHGARHITFDFHTPRTGVDDPLWLPPDARDRVIEQLIELRQVHGDFFVIPRRVLRLMRSDRCQEVTRRCLLRHRSFALDAAGRSKGKCVMGRTADCQRCGCVVPYYLRALTDRRLIIDDFLARSRW